MTRNEIKLAKKNGTINQLKNQLINQKIRERYSQDEVEAIINNYLDEPSNSQYLQVFQDLQEFRKQVKSDVKDELDVWQRKAFKHWYYAVGHCYSFV